MALTCVRYVGRIALSSLGSLRIAARSAAPSSCVRGRASDAAPCRIRRSSTFSRIPVELGCCGVSLLPLHSVVAGARLTSRLSTTSPGGRALSQGTEKETKGIEVLEHLNDYEAMWVTPLKG